MDKKWLSKLPLPEIITITPISGGDVNQAYHLTCCQTRLFPISASWPTR
jgi:fructosamine-3-kinase